MNHTELLNRIAVKNKCQSYLEIGSQNPDNNFNHIKVKNKVAVDPAPQGYATFVGTSDAFFESINPANAGTLALFDLVFIDGLHHCDQVLVDIANSYSHLAKGGIIVCHDSLPSTEFMQQRDDNHTGWTGDVWKAIALLRITSTALNIFVVDTDMGCAVIQKGYNRRYTPVGDWLTYEYYDKHKHKMMNVVSIAKFNNWLQGGEEM